MDIIALIQGMYIPVVVIACLLVGWIVKKWIKDVDNKWIPTIVFVLGGILACVATQTVSLETIVAGCASGLASTGMHQLFTQLIENPTQE
jgi:hypothetical protein